MSKDRKPQTVSWTPPGILSYPFLASPKTGGKYPDGQYQTDLFIPKPIFAEKGKNLQALVLQVGKEMFKDYSLKSTKYRVPFKDTDTDEDLELDVLKNCIMLRAKAGKKNDPKNRPPLVIGPRKDSSGNFPKLDKDEITVIKGGDWAALQIAIYAYAGNKQIQGGVSFSLRVVQYWKSGDALGGQGFGEALESAEELDTDADGAGNYGEDVSLEETVESII